MLFIKLFIKKCEVKTVCTEFLENNYASGLRKSVVDKEEKRNNTNYKQKTYKVTFYRSLIIS